jgi:anti-sigma factor ChrR (cupin superfamily)
MSSTSEHERCPYADEVSLFALHALPAAESAVIGTHIASCIACQKDLASLQPVIEAFAVWPVDVLRPSDALWDQLTKRITVAADGTTRGAHTPSWTEPDWEDVAPGICCKLLSNDVQRDRVCMLVRLAPATEYPPHTHAGIVELHLLQGELWIDERKLYPGDYNRAEAGSADRRVWSETGCTCLLITSPQDMLS